MRMTDDNDSATPTRGPVPRPGPRPGPREGARSVGRQAGVSPPNDPHRFGRVDDDGTVWLVSSSGERRIGSWQTGGTADTCDTEAAFAHFGRRFDDLSTEITLLEERLASGTGDARKIKASAITLTELLPTASVLGDVDALALRLTAIRERADAVAAQDQARRERYRAEATARKEALAAEAENLAATSTRWKAAGDRLRSILDEWKTISGLDRKADDELWKRYSAARDMFNRRRGSHFAELDRERAISRQDKERLCDRAEELASSTDWAATATAFRELLTEWKAAGRAAKDVDDALWHRFKAAQDAFFTARNSAGAEGVPRERSAELERRLRAAEKKLRDVTEPSTVAPQAQARAEQFRTRAEQFEHQAQKAQAAGRDEDAAAAQANAEQWRQWADAAEQALTRKP